MKQSLLGYSVVILLDIRTSEHKGAVFVDSTSILLLELITKAHCNIPAGGADATAVGAVTEVGNVLKRCIERETAGELQRCAQIERKR